MRILIAYATMTGNSEIVANHIHQELTAILNPQLIEVFSLTDLIPESLLNYDFIVIGSSTWTDGQFNPNAEEFFKKLKLSSVNLSHQEVSFFALGQSFYSTYANVGDLAKEIITSKAAKIRGEILKIDGFPSDIRLKETTDWLNRLFN